MLEQTFGAEDVFIPIHYYSILAELVEELGCTKSELLEGTSIAEAALDSHNAAISLSQLKTLINNALDCTDDPTMGLRLGKVIKASSHGILGYACMTAPTLGDCMDIAARYVNLLSPLPKVVYRCDEQYGVLEATEAIPIGNIDNRLRRFCLENWSCSLYTTLSRILGKTRIGIDVELSYPKPDYAEHYTYYFGKEPTFNCPHNQVRIKAALLTHKLPLADSRAHAQALQQCEDLSQSLYGKESLPGKIGTLIRSAPHYQLDMTEVAEIFCVSPRTLRRKLKSFDLTYQDILVDTRKQIACQAIDENQLSTDAIGVSLGYFDESNFNRAFKTWVGCTPKAYRER